ncbi:hypothetical protein G6F52_014233 [Rhizopus delemar]|nr:hypothetical protein G6F52_014233 [Rhizopus delemar]
MGCRPACRAVAGARGESTRPAAGPLRCPPRGCAGAGRTGDAPPPAAVVRRRGRAEACRRRGRRPAAGRAVPGLIQA